MVCMRRTVRMLSSFIPVQMPQHTITILLGLVFCIMNPIITPVCLIYFLITTVTEKYNLLYVYTFEYQSGGQASTLNISSKSRVVSVSPALATNAPA